MVFGRAWLLRRRWVDGPDWGGGKVVEPLDGGRAVGQDAAVRVGAGLRRVVDPVVAVAAGGRGEKVWVPEAPGAVPDVGVAGPGGGAAGGSSCSELNMIINLLPIISFH